MNPDKTITITIHGIKRKLLRPAVRTPISQAFTIKPLVLGTIQKISKKILRIDPKAFQTESTLMASALNLTKDHCDKVSEIIAMAIENRARKPKASLVKFISQNVTPSELLQLFNVVLRQMDLHNLLKAVITVRGVNILQSLTSHVPEETEILPEESKRITE
jgi:hypothetical protein